MLIGHCVDILQERSSQELSAKLFLTRIRIGVQDAETSPRDLDIYTCFGAKMRQGFASYFTRRQRKVDV
jgi:hypothetical protein